VLPQRRDRNELAREAFAVGSLTLADVTHRRWGQCGVSIRPGDPGACGRTKMLTIALEVQGMRSNAAG